VVEPFEFMHEGRTYYCSTVVLEGAGAGTWWSFTTSNGNTRAMPMRASKDDTRESVQQRIIAYHTHFLKRRAEPPTPQHTVGRPPKSAKVTPPTT